MINNNNNNNNNNVYLFCRLFVYILASSQRAYLMESWYENALKV
jgi:hypothetical protein